jgi:hypothetical protein
LNLTTASEDTVAKVYGNLDFTHAFEVFVNTLQGVSIDALRKNLLGAGVKDNEVIIFCELGDSRDSGRVDRKPGNWLPTVPGKRYFAVQIQFLFPK